MTKTQQKLKAFLLWLDDNILLLISGFLLAFIPLYPKLPLFEAIPGYIVRVRLEDIFMLLSLFIWAVQTIRGKVKWKSPLFVAIGSYAFVGFLSIISAVFFTKTVPMEMLHVGKTALHYFRYLEYFSIFLIVFSSIKSTKDAKILIATFFTTLTAISAYGYGQKTYEWPLYSTMNREFSKGLRLYLTEHARLQSTFGGHYDLAAFLVIALPMSLSFFYNAKNKLAKLALISIHMFGLWTLVLSAARSSFVAYILASYIVILFFALTKKTIKQKLLWGTGQSFVFSIVVILMMMVFGKGMYDRFLHALEGYPTAHYYYHTASHNQKMFFQGILISVGLREDNNEKDMGVLVSTDERPTTTKPSDVYIDVPDKIIVATQSADGTTSTTTIEKDRVWSDNALKYGLSIAIRFDTLWPNAIKGLQRNPLLGSGYATLNKEGATHFTEAESTDNNFLRTLGETGVLGFITFYGAIIVAMRMAFNERKNKDLFIMSLAIGFIAASFGLLLNATYIDVFASSKVAFTYWGISGVLVGTYYLSRPTSFEFAKVKEKNTPKTSIPKSSKKTSKTKKKKKS